MIVEPTLEQAQLLIDLREALGKHDELSGMEMIAITAQLIGNLIAYQDQGVWTPETMMAAVVANIEIGNRAAILAIFETRGNA